MFHNGDCRTKVNHNVVIHHSCLDPFAIFTAYKPLIVGKKPVSVTQKLYSPLLRGNEEVDLALRGSAFQESNHRAFHIVATKVRIHLTRTKFSALQMDGYAYACSMIIGYISGG